MMASKAVTAAYHKCIADARAAKEAGNPMSAAEQRTAFALAMAEAYRQDAEHYSGSAPQAPTTRHHTKEEWNEINERRWADIQEARDECAPEREAAAERRALRDAGLAGPAQLQAGKNLGDCEISFDTLARFGEAERLQWEADRPTRMAALHGKEQTAKSGESARHAPTFGRRVAGNPALIVGAIKPEN